LQVEKMSAESEIKRAEVNRKTKDAEELILVIAKKRKEADEKILYIEGEKVKIEKEKEETMILAEDADRELKKAEPMLLAAQDALLLLDKKFIAEIKSFTSPPPAVATVMSAVMIVLGKPTNWSDVKKELTDPKFVQKVMEYDIDNTPQATLKKIEKYTKMEDFQPATVSKVSIAAGALCCWVRSVEDYSKALKVVAPKRAKKLAAETKLAAAIAFLKSLEDEFQVTADALAELQEQYNATNSELDRFKQVLDKLQVLIDRGEKLVSGLSGEKTRWEASLIDLDDQYEKLVGDCILAAAFMSYCGPFPSEYRDDIIANWVNKVEQREIPFTPGFDFADFMAGPA